MFRSNYKKLVLVLFVSFPFFISGCYPEKDDLLNNTIKVTIAERVFKIPKGYLDGRKALGKNSESIVVEYSLPGFEVLPPHPEERSARQQLILEGRKRSMLLEAAKSRPSLDVAVENHMRGITFRHQGFEHGLEGYVYDRPQPQNLDPAYAPPHYDDLLIERADDGSVKSYLRCSPRDKDKIPSCSHKFVDKGLLYQITWHIQELPNWREQQQSAINFMDSLEVQ